MADADTIGSLKTTHTLSVIGFSSTLLPKSQDDPAKREYDAAAVRIEQTLFHGPGVCSVYRVNAPEILSRNSDLLMIQGSPIVNNTGAVIGVFAPNKTTVSKLITTPASVLSGLLKD